tara:strand:+ start:466 stop:648 length:183 start_codon:yes stop_codon:yes gene_type:complete
MGELLRIVELGNSYFLEYQTELTGWSMRTKELSPSEVRRYEDLMEELQSMEAKLLSEFAE